MRQLLALCLITALVGCSSGKSASETGVGLELRGVWKGVLVFNASDKRMRFNMNLRQVEDSLAITDGLYQFDGFRDSCFSEGFVTGNVVGARIALTFLDSNGAVINLVGNVSNTVMEGSWNNTGGPCLNNNGSWSARKA